LRSCEYALYYFVTAQFPLFLFLISNVANIEGTIPQMCQLLAVAVISNR